MDLLQKLCCFFILAKIVLQMCPSEKYEKYLQVLVTWMLYAMILLPLLGKGRTDSLQNWQQFRKEYEKSFTERMTDIDRMLSLPEEEQLKEHLTDSVLQKVEETQKTEQEKQNAAQEKQNTAQEKQNTEQKKQNTEQEQEPEEETGGE
ncbi:MAG: hypothetical protein BHW30_03940 [Firmicutes bacterium CAG_194_44_15]|jgi:hypothetical protein|nr:MAG: hypothetical protein BHW30_03940 [Firmicutes bacterium CAG_194_44_15]